MVGIALDVWVPVMMQPQILPGGDRLEARGLRWLEGMARLKPGASIQSAQSDLEAIGHRLIAAYPRSNEGFTPSVLPLSKSPWGAQMVLGPVLTVLTAVVAIVLLLACANVANLLLARALARRREVAIRLAIGASRARLARQFLTESLLLAILGGGAGFLIARMAAGVLTAFTPPTDIPVKLTIGVDLGVLAFTGGLALVTGFVFGLVPALQGTQADVVADLKDEARSTGRRAPRPAPSSRARDRAGLALGADARCRRPFHAEFHERAADVSGLQLPAESCLRPTISSRTGTTRGRAGSSMTVSLSKSAGCPACPRAALARRVPLGFNRPPWIGFASTDTCPPRTSRCSSTTT